MEQKIRELERKIEEKERELHDMRLDNEAIKFSISSCMPWPKKILLENKVKISRATGESSEEEEFSYDPEIERTLLMRRREARRRQAEDEIEIFEEEMAANANLSLRKLGTPDPNQQPLCITFPTLENNANFELKSGLIHLLPAFHVLAGEDPHKHLMEFHVVCSSMKPHGVTEEQI
ncbi:uncharacterized protein [Henckelia pumila]